MIHTEGPWFKDEFGRALILRGVNLSGSSKVPAQANGATHYLDGFFEHRTVTFVGRPFPLAEADEHLERLRTWGFTFLRLLITWEAVEHAGPGIYDTAYLDYLAAVIEKARQYNIQVFIDPHQDVWSRFTGGDGAPGWTLEAVGFDMTKFDETGAAVVHATNGDPLPRMIWPSNAYKLATATMFTLFFGGNDFAPLTKIEGEPVQEYLQRHYLAAIQQVAKWVHHLPNVAGYDTLNEPLRGYIGWKNLNRREGFIEVGPSPTPYQSMLLADGKAQFIDLMERTPLRSVRLAKKLFNPHGHRAWHQGFDCIWKQHGVWEEDPNGKPRLLRPNYFAAINGREVHFSQDYYLPFARRFAEAVREIHPQSLIFLETETLHEPPQLPEGHIPGAVFAPHWYDAYVLFFKAYNPWLAVDVRSGGRLVFGRKNIRKSFSAQIGEFRKQSRERMGNIPVILGEFGIAFDLHQKQAFRSGDFSDQMAALDRNLTAMDDQLMSFTLWNYTPDNSNERGDLWNDEDLSIFSRDQQNDPANIHSGGRALEAFVRPYAVKIAGEPLRMSFERTSGKFEFTFRHDPAVTAPTEIFIPNYQYSKGCRIEVSDGQYSWDATAQKLTYHYSETQTEHTIRVFRQ